ncbi:hypothetical protein ES705_40059 [subsurface metagenome]
MRECLTYVNEVTENQVLESNRRYVVGADDLHLTLPATPEVGDVIGIMSKRAETDHPVIELPANYYAGDYFEETTEGGTVTPSTALWCQNFYYLGPTTIAGGGKFDGNYWHIFGFGGYAVA